MQVDNDHVEFVESVLEKAYEDAVESLLQERLPEHSDPEIAEMEKALFLQDSQNQLILKARTLDEAIKIGGLFHTSMSRMIVEIIYRAAVNDLWRFSDTGEWFVSLQDWAFNRLRPYVDEDYIGRFVAAAERMLLPIDNLNVIDKQTGAVITGLDIARTASTVQIRNMSYAFNLADDEYKTRIAEMLHTHASGKEFAEIKEEIYTLFKPGIAILSKGAASTSKVDDRHDGEDESSLGLKSEDNENSSSITIVPPEPTIADRIPLLLEMSERGWKATFTRDLTSAEVGFIQAVLGRKLEIQWVKLDGDEV